jgi:hypothetical protein
VGLSMAIRSVNSENLAELAANRPEARNTSNSEQLSEALKDKKPLGEVAIQSGVETISDAPDPGEQDPTKGAKKPVQARIDELTRLRKEAEEFAEDEWKQRRMAETRIAELEAELRRAKPTEAPKAEELKRPRLSDFQTAAEFDTAMDEYESKRAEQVRSEVEVATRQQLANERQQAELAARIEAAKSDFPDWDEVINKAAKSGYTPSGHIQAAMRESEVAAHLAYHFVKNPDELRKLEQLSPIKAVQEIGKIEQKFIKAESAEAPKATKPPIETTRAPAPVQSLRSDSAGIVNNDPSKASDFHEYRRLRAEQKRNEGRRR